MPSDNFRREVKKLKRDASSLSGGVGECPFCAQPFLSIEHKRASIKRDHERAAGGLDAFLAKLEEMARNRDEAELRTAERERERHAPAGVVRVNNDDAADEPAQLGRALREVRRG
jgi:hypothetical protein